METSRHQTNGTRHENIATPTPLRIAVFLAIGFLGSLIFDAIGISSASATSARRDINAVSRTTETRVIAQTPAGDEYEIGKGAERLLETTHEVYTLVDTLPGPGLSRDRPPASSLPVLYENPYEEMLGRLKHAGQLVLETYSILQTIPTPPIPSNQGSAVPETPPAPVVQANKPGNAGSGSASSAPVAAPATVPPTVTAPVEPTPNPVANNGRKPPLTTITFSRLAILVMGALFALALVKYLPRMIKGGKAEASGATPPTTAAEALEPPPLKDQALELASIMASMGLTDGAAHALVERIRSNPRQALSHWLKLLEIYRQAGKKTAFETAAEQIRTRFNVRPGNWTPEKNDANQPASLESYPHVAAQLKKLWPKAECGEYLLNLLSDNREGKRKGFPLPVVEEIVLLLAVLRSEEPAPA